jgi:hypothetical protein
LTIEAYRQLTSFALPARLKVGEFKLMSLTAERCCVVSYSGFDPLELSPRLLDALHYFDGRPTGEARQAAARDGVKLSIALICRLVDFRILVSCD